MRPSRASGLCSTSRPSSSSKTMRAEAAGRRAMVSKATARRLRERALTVFVEVDVDEAWKRARRSRRRPLAERESEFRQLFEQRLPLYEDAADARGRDADDIVLAAAGALVEGGSYGRLADLVPEQVEIVVDERVRKLRRRSKLRSTQ